MHRLEFILRRTAASLFVLFGVTVITFFLARIVPSNAAALYIGPRARPEEIERVAEQLGLNRPLPIQYAPNRYSIRVIIDNAHQIFGPHPPRLVLFF